MESAINFITFGRCMADTHYPKRTYHYDIVKLFVNHFDLNQSDIDLYVNLLFAYQSKTLVNIIPYTTLIFHNILPRMPSYEVISYLENIGITSEEFEYNTSQETTPRILLSWAAAKKCLNVIDKKYIIDNVILIDLGYDSYNHRFIAINAIETMRRECNDWTSVHPTPSASI